MSPVVEICAITLLAALLVPSVNGAAVLDETACKNELHPYCESVLAIRLTEFICSLQDNQGACIEDVTVDIFEDGKDDEDCKAEESEMPPNDEDGCVCTFDYNPVCGSDGKTYPNKCSLECNQKRMQDLKIDHEGECGEEECDDGEYHEREWYETPIETDGCECSSEYSPNCGPDNQTCDSECKLNCQSEQTPDLVVQFEAQVEMPPNDEDLLSPTRNPQY